MATHVSFSHHINQRDVNRIADLVLSRIILGKTKPEEEQEMVTTIVRAHYQDHPLFFDYLIEVSRKVHQVRSELERAREVRLLREMMRDAREHEIKYGYVDDEKEDDISVSEPYFSRKIA